MGKEFPRKCIKYVVIGQGKPFLRASELQLRANAVGRYQEDEQHHHAWHHHGREIDIVVGPRVGYLMKVDTNGLQEGLYLATGKATGTHGGLSDSRRPQRTDGLQVLHQQRACHHRCIAVIVRYLGLPAGQQFVGGAFRNIEECVNLVLLDGMASLSNRRITVYDL